MQLRTFFMAAAVGLACAAIAACGGGGDDGATPTGTGEPATSPSERTPSTATATATEEGPDNPGTSNGSGTERFQDLFERADERSYAVTYEVVATDDGETATSISTVAQDPPRTSVMVEIEGGQRIWLINDGSNQYMCFGSGDEGQCMDSSAGTDTPGVVYPGELTERAESAPDVQEIERRTIAGRGARCFEFSDRAADGAGIVCLDEELGATLYLELDGATLTATEVSEDVTDEMFEPPFDTVS